MPTYQQFSIHQSQPQLSIPTTADAAIETAADLLLAPLSAGVDAEQDNAFEGNDEIEDNTRDG